MNILSRIFATPKATKEVIDAAIHTGDKLFLTAEEKVEHTAEMRNWYIRYLQATEPQTVARRFIGGIMAFYFAAHLTRAVKGKE